MAQTPEGKVKDFVKKILKRYKDDGQGVYAHWPVQNGYGAACLDCHGCYNGLYFTIETKAPGKKPTPRQELTMEDVSEADGVVFVIGEKEVEGKERYSGVYELVEWLESERRS